VAGEARLMNPIDFPTPTAFTRLPFKDGVHGDGHLGGWRQRVRGRPQGRPGAREGLVPSADVLAEPGLADPAAAMELHKSLVNLNITAREAVLVLPEAMVKHTELTLPQVAAAPLLAVLAQKAHELEGIGTGEIVWGYQVSEAVGSSQREVLLVRRAARRAAAHLSRAARRRAVGGGHGAVDLGAVPPLALAARCQRGQGVRRGAARAGSARLSLFKKSTLFYDRSVRLGDDAEGQRSSLMRQVQRALLNYQQHHQEDPVRQRVHRRRRSPSAASASAQDLIADPAAAGEHLEPELALAARRGEPPHARGASERPRRGSPPHARDRGSASANLLPPELRTKKRDRWMAVIVIAIGHPVLGRRRLRSRAHAPAERPRAGARGPLAHQENELEQLASVPDRHAAMMAMQKLVHDEANRLRTVIGPNMSYDAFFNLLSAAITGDLQLTSVRIDARDDGARAPAGAPGEERKRVWAELRTSLSWG
jgi:hypothetical protein